MAIEFARDVLGYRDAEHAETSPEAERLVIEPLACSLVGQQELVRFEPGSRAAAVHDVPEAVESFYCNYGLNPAYGGLLERHGLRTTGRGPDGEARILELDGHPFLVGTLYLPQARSRPGAPHPLVAAFVAAARL